MNTAINQKAAPRTVTMGDGTVVLACEPLGSSAQTLEDQPRKLLIVVNYYEGDLGHAEALVDLIADLERIRNDDADIMLFRRFDARIFSPSLVSKLQNKFTHVYQQQCRRRNATGYPFAANEMWYDLVTLLSQKEWITKYYAFVNMEADMTPTRPTWIRELAEEFCANYAKGKFVTGHLHDHRGLMHINGGAIYSTELWKRVGGSILTGGSPSKAYDCEKAGAIVPLAADTPLIVLDFQRSTISKEELFAATKQGVSPALYHGVKDMSAILAVRQEWLNGNRPQLNLEQGTVFCYYVPVQGVGVDEEHKALMLWKDAWSSKGWFPVVLTPSDARKNPRYFEVERRVAAFPTVRQPDVEKACWLRWLALEVYGGGLMTDYDVLPARFTPNDLIQLQIPAGTYTSLAGDQTCAVYADKEAIKKWTDLVMGYRVSRFQNPGEKPHFSDLEFFQYLWALKTGRYVADEIYRVDQVGFVGTVSPAPAITIGKLGYNTAKMVHFQNSELAKLGNVPRSITIVAWMQGKLPLQGDAVPETPLTLAPPPEPEIPASPASPAATELAPLQ